eukprot:scaffold76381_cov26-Tisochrysis_lutea.AAC.1
MIRARASTIKGALSLPSPAARACHHENHPICHLRRPSDFDVAAGGVESPYFLAMFFVVAGGTRCQVAPR